MNAGKVLVTGGSVEERFLEPLRDFGLDVRNPQGVLSEDELRLELEDAVAYLLAGDEFAGEKALATASALKIVAFLGVGYESFIDSQAATGLNIVVTNTPGTLTNSVAEFTIAHLLAARRQLVPYVNGYRRGERDFEVKQRDLHGHSVGIVGLGNIGARIAEILSAGFSTAVSYYSRTRKPELEASLGIDYRGLPDLAASVESLIVMTPGNDSTRHMLNASILQELAKSSILVNTARADIVDPDALRQALDSGRLACATFDGFYEGQVGDELLAAFGDERLMVTGHIASLTHDARDAMAIKAVRSILNVLTDGEDEHIVNRRS